MSNPLSILIDHVLLTSRNGFAACADMDCSWAYKFEKAADGGVPMNVRALHAGHQLALLSEVGLSAAPWSSTPETPKGGW